MNQNQIQLFKSNDGHVSLEVSLNNETVWLTQAQMSELFERDQSVMSRHIRNVFTEKELPEKSNMQKMHIALSDKPVAYFSLDVVISVGYRVKSQRGVQFRQWATQTLKQHLVQGYTLNQKRLQERGIEFEQVIARCKSLLRTITNVRDSYRAVMDTRLNETIRMLTVITLALTIPTMLAGLFGMNVILPEGSDSPLTFWVIVGISVLFAGTFSVYFLRKR